MIADRRRFQSAHFLMLAPPVAEIAALLRELEAAYTAVRRYGLDLPARIAVESYASSGEFRRSTGVGAVYLAATVGERIHLMPPHLLARNPGLARALRHELVHVALAGASRNGLPRWVAEGVAMRVAGESYAASGGIGTLADLEKCLGGGGTHRGVRGCYGLARGLVDTLAGRIGERKMIELVGKVASGSSFATLFRETVGLAPEEWGRTILRRK